MSARWHRDRLALGEERERLKQELVQQARDLGARIAAGDAAGITQHEPTITETVLLNLHQRLGQRLHIRPLTQPEEGAQGADWVWCVGGNRGWFSFYVQAKKLKDSGYDIGYPARPPNRSRSIG